jgi:hypothetical protein
MQRRMLKTEPTPPFSLPPRPWGTDLRFNVWTAVTGSLRLDPSPRIAALSAAHGRITTDERP